MPFIADTEQGGFIPDTQQGGFIPDKEKSIGFFEGAAERPVEKIPFSPAGAVRTLKLVEASGRLQSFDYARTKEDVVRKYPGLKDKSPAWINSMVKTSTELYDRDVGILTEHFEDLAKKERRGYTLGGRVGQIVSEMPAFMTEFMSTGGIAKLGSNTAKTFATKLLKGHAKTTAGKALIATGGFAAGAATRAAGMPHRAAEAIFRRQAPQDLKVSDIGEVKVTGPVEKPMTSIWKGLTDHYIEVASESAGEVIAPAAGKLFKKLPFMGKLTGALQKQWLKLHPDKGVIDFANKIATKTGYHGVVGEVGEEYLGDALRAITDVDHFGAGEDAELLERLAAGAKQDTANLPAMAIAFAVPGAAKQAAITALTPRTKAPVISEQIKEKAFTERVEVEPTVETGEPGFVRMPGEAEPTVKKRPSPSKEQLAVGHDLAKSLGMKTKERRTFMEEHTGVASMKNMTPEQAGTYIDALHERAEKKKIDLDPFYKEHKFKKPGIFALVTPQIYKARIMGMHFILKPAILGKQRLDIEASKIIRDVDKMQKVINRLGGETVASKAAAKLKNRPTKSVARMAELLNTYEDAPAELSRDEKQVFDFFRTLNRSIFERENQVRASLNMPQIEYKRGYLRHIADWQAQEILEGRHSISPDLKYIVDKYSTSRKVYNPMEKQRQLGDELGEFFSKDLIAATKSMVVTGLKEIHLDQPLEYIKNQLDFYKEDIPASTRRWTDEFVRTMIRGEQTYTDQKLDDLVRDTGLGGLINKILRPFGRKVGHRPVTGIFQKAGRMQIYGVMGWRPKQLLRNKFQILQNLALYTIKSNLKSYRPADQQLQDLMSGSLFLKSYAGFDELSSIDAGIIGKMWLAPFQWTAVTNAKRAMKAAYYDTLELIEDPKYQEYGWADSQRTYDEKPGFLYESEKAKVLEEMEFGAGVTQYHYIPMAMPQVFRSKAGIPFTRLQSWWMNHLFKFHAEALHRGLYGKTRTGNKLPWSRRVGWLRYMIIGGSILSYLGYKSSFIWGAIPRNIPPMGAFLVWFWTYTFARDKKTRAYAKWKWMDALKTLIPGHLAIKDIKDVDSGKKPPESLFVYEEGVFAEEENVRKGI